jgi:hypothetical protein
MNPDKITHETIIELARFDATVMTYYKMHQMGLTTWDQMLERLVIALAHEKKVLQDQMINQMKYVGPTPFVVKQD